MVRLNSDHYIWFIFKVGLSPSKKVGFICFNESLLKMMNNAFYFILKALLVTKLTFCLDFYGHAWKRQRYISKFMTSQTETQTVTINILPDISKTLSISKFDQFIEYYVRNIFLQKSCREWGRESSSKLFQSSRLVPEICFWYNSDFLKMVWD